MSVAGSAVQGIENAEEITELVKLLRQNGDKILSASSKLSLSTMLLHNLNEIFSLIVGEGEELESSFQVCNSSKIDIFRDIKFLHDFIQKTIGLLVTQHTKDAKVSIDLAKFRRLKYLELKKIDITSVKGLQAVRGQLESIVCAGRRGISTVRQLLAECGGDKVAAFTWGSLKHLALPHNMLERLDRSLELTPWLQVLDLSHNLLTSATELECLPNLKYVNLGYNRLESVPSFNKTVLHSLQVLVLKNNYIENINGLEGLECLIELDLSYNCLMEHSVLWPVEKMCGLLWISLEGNPLSYHPKHRLLTIKYLHSCLRDSKFVLDHTPLSRSEKLLVSENRNFPIRPAQSTFSEVAPASCMNVNSTNTIIKSPSLETSIHDARVSDKQSAGLIDSLDKTTSKYRKKRNVKEAIIADNEQEKQEFESESRSLSSSYLESSQEHLETKKQILALRKKFGENNWLISCAGTYVQDIMGIQPTSSPDNTSTPIMESFMEPNVNLPDQDAVHHIEILDDTQDRKSSEGDSEGEKIEKKEDEEMSDEGVSHNKEEIGCEPVDAKNTEISQNVCATLHDSEEEKGDVYLVQKKKDENETEELFLVITAENIVERDAVLGKIRCAWSMNSVLSCVLGRDEHASIDIIFDTARKNRQSRRYFLDLDDAKKIISTVEEKMRVRPISLKIFKCIKCSTHFSHDAESTLLSVVSAPTLSSSGSKQLKCPTCESTLVIETDEPTPAEKGANVTEELSEAHLLRDNETKTSTKSRLQHSDSYSSIGSATSLEESRESTPSVGGLTKKYESDIEVLSNPSQSSIEVLDENSKTNLTPNRKKATEEKPNRVSSGLLSMSDSASITAALTESSSSGSLTDSVCTAYENKSIKQTATDEKSLNSNVVEKDPLFTPVTNLTSMLGGLLQSMKIGNNKESLTKSQEDPNLFSNNVHYSYTDFSSVDHRIKLHIILNIFEYENEELVLLLRADILMHSSRETFPGCLILSTSKVYVLRIGGPEGEDPQRWLLKEVSWTINRLRVFAPLPFKQGILVELQQPGKFDGEESTVTVLCILQDFQRTSNFLFYITDLSLPASCEIEFSVSDHSTALLHNLLKNANHREEGDAVRLLGLFSSATLKYQNQNVRLKYSAIVVSSSVLLLLDDNLQWLIPATNQLPVVVREQTMSNLITVEHYITKLTLNFLDEVAGQEEKWTLEFNSAEAAEAVISSIQPPWEELFSVPLQVSTRSLE